jgi:nitrite reductase/ring-hydroxylating ferredoxin subunit
LIDFIFTVPPKSTGKKRAAKHGLTNITMVLFFAAALFFRLNATTSFFIVITLEFIGWILLGFAGWLGGTLVSRNQIGIDIRYAGAGKWSEEYLSATDGEVEITDAGNIKMNQMKLIIVNGERIVIANTESGYMAFSDHCPHRGGSLAGGAMICGTVQCPWHGSQFNVSTGDVKAGPATEKIQVYPLLQKNGKLYLTIHQSSTEIL